MKHFLPLAFVLFSFSTITAQNLVQNSKFQQGIQHWQVLLQDAHVPIKAQVVEHSQDYGQYGLADNYVNTSFVELDAQSAIQQEVATTQSNNYILTFAYAHRPNAGKKQLVVLVDQTIVFTTTLDNTEKAGFFQYETLQFIAPKNGSKLSFYAVSLSGADNQGILLTDVSCESAIEINILDLRDQKTH